MGAAAIAAYLNALPGQFVSDAVPMILQNRALLESRDWLAWFSRDFYWGTSFEDVSLYRPLTVLSFLLHLRTFGPTPLAFLLGNVLLHTAVSVLVLRLGAHLLGRLPAALGALIFAVHPLHTEAVAWVMGRSELLAAAFALASCLAGLRSLDRHAASPLRLAGAAVAAYLAALLSKEHVALLPLWFGLAWVLDRQKRSGKVTAYLTLGSAVAFAGFLLIRAHALARTPTWDPTIGLYNPAAVVAAPTRWLTAVAVAGRYAWLFVWPARLSNDYSYAELTVSHGFGAFEAAGLLVILAVLGGFAVAARRAPGVALALALAPIAFILVSNIPFPIGTVMAERLTYLPTAGLCLAVGWLGTRLPLPGARLLKDPAPPAPGGPPTPWPGARSCALIGVLTALTLALGARTVVRNADWRDDYTLALANSRTAPRSAKALFSLSTVERLRGNLPRAQELLREALRIYPDNALALVSLAETHLQRQEWPEAIEQYRRALRLVPENADIRSNLGITLARAGRPAEAEAEFREAIRLDPRLVEPHLALGGLLLEAHRPAEALPQFQEAARLAPGDGLALFGVAQALLDLGDRPSAASYARRAAAAGVPVPETFWRALGGSP